MKHLVEFKKFNVEQQIVYGIVYAPLVADSQGDWASSATIEKMAHTFNAKNLAGNVDVNHDLKPSGSTVVENFIARKGDQDFPEGAWAMGVKTPDHIWELIKAGELNGFSMYGSGERVEKGLPGQPTAKHELINTDIKAVSLVKRGAIREDWKIMKTDQDPMAYLAEQMQAIATHMQRTNDAISDIVKKQKTIDGQIASISKTAPGITVAKAVSVDRSGDIEVQLRKKARFEQKLESLWERPDLRGGNREATIRNEIEKCEDELAGLGYQQKLAGIDSGSAFVHRGGTSNFLSEPTRYLRDEMGLSRAGTGVAKEDEINVENNLVL
jgi:putative serine protease XkdF